MFSAKISQLLSLTGIVTLLNFTGNIQPVFSQANSSRQISFRCGITKINNQDIPATLAYIPGQRKKRIITWVSSYFDKTMTIEKRCQLVSEKFQKAYEDGRLRHITFGTNQGYSIICAVTDFRQPCNRQTQLFTLKQGSNPEEIMEKLIDILTGASSEPIFQSSGTQVYISFDQWLEQAPEVEEDN